MGEFPGVDSLCNSNIDNERLNCKLLVENPEAEYAVDSIFMSRSYLTLTDMGYLINNYYSCLANVMRISENLHTTLRHNIKISNTRELSINLVLLMQTVL